MNKEGCEEGSKIMSGRLVWDKRKTQNTALNLQGAKTTAWLSLRKACASQTGGSTFGFADQELRIVVVIPAFKNYSHNQFVQ